MAPIDGLMSNSAISPLAIFALVGAALLVIPLLFLWFCWSHVCRYFVRQCRRLSRAFSRRHRSASVDTTIPHDAYTDWGLGGPFGDALDLDVPPPPQAHQHQVQQYNLEGINGDPPAYTAPTPPGPPPAYVNLPLEGMVIHYPARPRPIQQRAPMPRTGLPRRGATAPTTPPGHAPTEPAPPTRTSSPSAPETPQRGLSPQRPATPWGHRAVRGQDEADDGEPGPSRQPRRLDLSRAQGASRALWDAVEGGEGGSGRDGLPSYLDVRAEEARRARVDEAWRRG